MKLPSLEKEIPKELFARFWIPVMNSVMVLSFILKFYQFGSDEKAFSLVGGLKGAFLFAIVTLITAYITGSRTIGSYVRFLILYIAFVPHLKLSYLSRLADLSYTFHIRDHSFSAKWQGSIVLWASDVSEYMRILLPMALLMLGATIHDKFPKWYRILLVTAVVMALLLYVFEGTVNLFKYGIALVFVIIISDCWSRMRLLEERKPQVMVLWAEMLLFAAMWAKGLTLIVR
ncbi:MAG: hypothetical protein II760_00170 [Lachnospiraceae bacterium]|nr:hypothetical protein [Lachnospiraceae bacterium]